MNNQGFLINTAIALFGKKTKPAEKAIPDDYAAKAAWWEERKCTRLAEIEAGLAKDHRNLFNPEDYCHEQVQERKQKFAEELRKELIACCAKQCELSLQIVEVKISNFAINCVTSY